MDHRLEEKTKILAIPVRQEVAAFAIVLEKRLEREDPHNEGAWKNRPFSELLGELIVKVTELSDISSTPPSLVYDRAIGVGTQILMVAEVAIALTAKNTIPQKMARSAPLRGPVMARRGSTKVKAAG